MKGLSPSQIPDREVWLAQRVMHDVESQLSVAGGKSSQDGGHASLLGRWVGQPWPSGCVVLAIPSLRRSAEGGQSGGPPETCHPRTRRQGGVLVKAHAWGGRGGFGRGGHRGQPCHTCSLHNHISRSCKPVTEGKLFSETYFH